MIRLHDIRRRCRPPMTSTADGRDLQRRILDLVLPRYPLPQTFPALALALLEDPGDLPAAFALAGAVRDLAVAGLLCSDGLHVLPTRAALYFWRLEEGR